MRVTFVFLNYSLCYSNVCNKQIGKLSGWLRQNIQEYNYIVLVLCYLNSLMQYKDCVLMEARQEIRKKCSSGHTDREPNMNREAMQNQCDHGKRGFKFQGHVQNTFSPKEV